DRDRRPADPRRQPRTKRRQKATLLEDHVDLAQLRRQPAQLHPATPPPTNPPRPPAHATSPTPKAADFQQPRTPTGHTQPRRRRRLFQGEVGPKPRRSSETNSRPWTHTGVGGRTGARSEPAPTVTRTHDAVGSQRRPATGSPGPGTSGVK